MRPLLRPQSAAIEPAAGRSRPNSVFRNANLFISAVHQGPSHQPRRTDRRRHRGGGRSFSRSARSSGFWSGRSRSGRLGNALPNALAQALPGITVQYDQAAHRMVARPGPGQSRRSWAHASSTARGPHHRPGAGGRHRSRGRPAPPGQGVVQRITLVGVQLTLVRTMDGGLRLGVEKDKNQRDIFSRITDAITQEQRQRSSLKAFAVRDARLAFYDEPTALFLVAPEREFPRRDRGRGPEARRSTPRWRSPAARRMSPASSRCRPSTVR